MMWRGGHFGRLVFSIASSIEYCNPQSQQSLTLFVIFVTMNHHVLFDDFIAERSEVKSHTPFDTHSVHPLSPVHLYLFIDVAAKYGDRLVCSALSACVKVLQINLLALGSQLGSLDRNINRISHRC